MDWFDYLENATYTVKDNHEASKIRGELLNHLEAITDELVEQGWSEEDARQEAVHRMGSANNIATGLLNENVEGFHPVFWLIAWIGLAIGALGLMIGSAFIHSLVEDASIFGGITVVSIFALILLRMGNQPDIRSRWNIFLSWIQPNWYCFVAAGIVGIMEGTSALWLSFPYKWIEMSYMILFVVITGVPIVIRLIRSLKTGEQWTPGLIAMGMGCCYGALSIAVGGVLEHYSLISWGHSFLDHNLRLIPVYTVGAWLPSLILSLGIKWWISQIRITFHRITV